MTTLEDKIAQLEREVALKKGYQAVKFVLPKTLPTDVAEEIQAKLRSLADDLGRAEDAKTPATLSYGPFTDDEVATLKVFAQVAKAKSEGQQTGQNPPTTSLAAAPQRPSNDHVPKAHGSPRKAKILVTENVRGEAKRYASIDDELYIANPEKIDEHGMVSATHMKRGGMLKIPIDDVEFVD